MDNGLLQESAKGLRNSPYTQTGGGFWNSLQSLKEEISQDLLNEGSMCRSEADGLRENEVSASNGSDIEWLHRAQLEARLRAINEAQDRLLEGSFGKCVDCGKEIYPARLAADPAVSLCFDCQRVADGEQAFRTL